MKKTLSSIEEVRHELHRMLDEDVTKTEIYEMSLKLDKLIEEIIDKKSSLDVNNSIKNII